MTHISLKHRLKQKLAKKIHTWVRQVSAQELAHKHSRFKNHPKNLVIDEPSRVIHPEYMTLGNDVYIGPGSMLNCITVYPGPEMNPPDSVIPQKFKPSITIGDRFSATGGVQLAAHQEITIKEDVLFASNINITDGLHGYNNVDVPYKFQNIWRIGPIIIERGCWIGQNVVITPNVTIGAFSIIGANSVVTESIPANCIAVGQPAKVIKRWDESTSGWKRANDKIA